MTIFIEKEFPEAHKLVAPTKKKKVIDF